MDFLITHWSFIVVSLVLMTVGQVMKGSVFTEKRIAARQGAFMGTLLWWGRRTLPLHPVVTGMAIGALPGVPVPANIDTPAAVILYFAGAGMLSTWIFALLKTFARKHGYDLKTPGQSAAPPPRETK